MVYLLQIIKPVHCFPSVESSRLVRKLKIKVSVTSMCNSTIYENRSKCLVVQHFKMQKSVLSGIYKHSAEHKGCNTGSIFRRTKHAVNMFLQHTVSLFHGNLSEHPLYTICFKCIICCICFSNVSSFQMLLKCILLPAVPCIFKFCPSWKKVSRLQMKTQT